MNGALLPRCEQRSVLGFTLVYEYVVADMNKCPVIVFTRRLLVSEH